MKKFSQYITPAQLQESLLNKSITEVGLVESKLSRMYQFVEDDKRSFGIVSASRGANSKEENLAAHDELKKKVRQMGYGYIELRGGYTEEGGGDVEELSLMVPSIDKIKIIELGRKYKQDSVMFKDKTDFYYIGTNETTGIGKVLMRFQKGAGKDNMDLAKKSVVNFFSSLKKASDAGKKFVFKSKEESEAPAEKQKTEAEHHDQKNHKPGDVWKTASGVWGAKNMSGKFEYFEDKDKASKYAKRRVGMKIQEREEWCLAKAAYLRKDETPKWITIYEE